MAKKLKLAEDLRTGIEVMDRQHAQFFAFADNFGKAEPKTGDSVPVTEAIEFLRRYVGEHFALEEELMTAYRYRYRNDHMTAHRRFRNSLENLGIQLDRGEGDHVSATLPDMTVTWLTKHIKAEDQRLAGFLNEKAKTDKGLLARLKELVGMTPVSS